MQGPSKHPPRLPSPADTDAAWHCRSAHELPVPVQIWRIDLDRYAAGLPPENDSDGYAGEESRLLRERNGRRIHASRHAVSALLASDSGVSRKAISITRGGGERPRAPGIARSFSLSRGGKTALFALVAEPAKKDGWEVGADLEAMARVQEREALVEAHFHPAEMERWARVPSTGRDQAFLRCWTRKEAVAKALGEGVRIPFSTLAVFWDDRLVGLRLPQEPHVTLAFVTDVVLPAGDVGAVAVARVGRERPELVQCS